MSAWLAEGRADASGHSTIRVPLNCRPIPTAGGAATTPPRARVLEGTGPRPTSEAALGPVFENVRAAVVVCGHTHMPFDRLVGGTRVVNAGSVGMPFGTPGAHWLLLGPDIEARHTGYDLDKAADWIRATSYPDAATFATRHVLQPPSEQEMLDVFSRVELRS